MKIRKALINTFYKKKQWSAPATMAAVFIIGMVLIYSFETLGLAKRELNLERRNNVQFTYQQNSVNKHSSVNHLNLNLKEKTHEERLDKIYTILHTSAKEQNEYIDYDHLLIKEDITFEN